MKLERNVFILVLLFGLFVWVSDTLLDFFFFYEGTFWSLLITHVPKHELYVRIFILGIFIIFAFVTSRIIAKRRQAEIDALTAHINWKNIFDAIGHPVFILEPDHTIIEANRAYEEASGIPVEELRGKKCYEIFHDSNNPPESCPFEALLESANMETQDMEIGALNGIFLVSCTPVMDAEGRIEKIIHIATDITARQVMEKALQKSEEKYRSLFDNMMNGFAYHEVIFDDNNKPVDYVFRDVNKAFENLTGLTRTIIGKRITEVFPGIENAEPDLISIFGNVAKTGKPNDFELFFDPLKKWYHVFAYSPRKGFFAVTFEDVTGRKKSEKAICDYQEKLRSLASTLSLTEQKERRNIATFLHDQIGQKLALIKIKLGALGQSLKTTEHDVSVGEISALIDDAVNDTRSLTFELSPPILYELGLEKSLEWLVEQFAEKYDLNFDFRDDGKFKSLDDDIRIVVFQAVRELLTNAVKHSQAKTVKISVEKENENIRLVVEDNGVGFDASITGHYTAKTGGFGLFNIRERIDQLNGKFDIESGEGKGTKMTLVVPSGSK